MPFQAPVNVLVKEFLPSARTVACNELLVMQRLCPIPRGDKWQVSRVVAAALAWHGSSWDGDARLWLWLWLRLGCW